MLVRGGLVRGGLVRGGVAPAEEREELEGVWELAEENKD